MQAPIEQLDPQHFMTGEFLYNDVKAYVALGEHRTATDTDRKTSQWLARQLEGFGFAPKLIPFRVRQFFLDSVRLTANGRVIPCFPLWFPRATGPDPVRAPVAIPGREVKGRIALAYLPPAAAIGKEHVAILQPLIDAGAIGIVCVTPSDSGEFTAFNSEDAKPWPIPIVLIGVPDAAELRGAFDVAISINGRDDVRAEAFDLIATIGTGKKHIVISTPSSGWFRCGGERGPGIAFWLALARWSSHRNVSIRYTFIATSAHELGEQGMQRILSDDTLRPKNADVWLHLGSSIAAKGAARRLMTNRQEWLPSLTRNFASINGLKPEATENFVGELAQLAELKYRCFGIAGRHALFHSPGDTELMTSAAMLEPVGHALLRTLVDLE